MIKISSSLMEKTASLGFKIILDEEKEKNENNLRILILRNGSVSNKALSDYLKSLLNYQR